MPTTHETALQQRCQQIVTSSLLSPEQKRHFLALEAENNLPYPSLPAGARQALDDGVICDMFEGHAPYKPRYVLPDYARFLANGSAWLELEGAKIWTMHCPADHSVSPRAFRHIDAGLPGATGYAAATVCENSNTRSDRYSNKTFLAVSRQNAA